MIAIDSFSSTSIAYEKRKSELSASIKDADKRGDSKLEAVCWRQLGELQYKIGNESHPGFVTLVLTCYQRAQEKDPTQNLSKEIERLAKIREVLKITIAPTEKKIQEAPPKKIMGETPLPSRTILKKAGSKILEQYDKLAKRIEAEKQKGEKANLELLHVFWVKMGALFLSADPGKTNVRCLENVIKCYDYADEASARASLTRTAEELEERVRVLQGKKT